MDIFTGEVIANQLKNMIGLDVTKYGVDTLIDAGLGAAPAISGAITGVRLNRMNKRLNKHQKQISEVLLKLSLLSDSKREEIIDRFFPFAFERLILEEQEEKVQFVLNGLDNIAEFQIFEEDLIFSYYDVFNSLRTADIKRLVSAYKPENSRVNVLEQGIHQPEFTYIDNKLERLNLIFERKFIENEYSYKITNLEDRWDFRYISGFGRDFLEFFKL